ncbi:unnamed protein product [Rhizophagus irregularis]|nr:unnamed protein product [Rhizophagus irregularis]CAB4415610.1 unnamed protein product [Rhizophagus irregularis]
MSSIIDGAMRLGSIGFIKNGAEDEQEKAKYLNIRFKSDSQKDGRVYLFWEKEMHIKRLKDVEKDASLKIRSFQAQHHFSVANRILKGENNTSELNPFYNDESATSKQSHYYALRKKQKVDYNINQMSERTYSEEFQMDDQETSGFKTPKIEMLASLNTKSHLESYNIVHTMKSKWTEAETYISKEEIEKH